MPDKRTIESKKEKRNFPFQDIDLGLMVLNHIDLKSDISYTRYLKAIEDCVNQCNLEYNTELAAYIVADFVVTLVATLRTEGKTSFKTIRVTDHD